MKLLRALEKPLKRLGVERAACIVCLLAVTACYLGMQPGGDLMAQTRTRELPVYSVDRNDGKIAISFDAAWGAENTPALLDILDEYGVKTTFFLVGIWTEKYPEMVKEIAARGHEVENHSTTHPQMSKLSEAKIIEELRVNADRIEQITGKRPTLFRPPYGDYNDSVVRVSRAQGYECVQWNVDSLDWKNRGVDDLIARATKNNAAGDIVLFHNDSKYIVQALPVILAKYPAEGFEVVPVSELLLQGETTIDHTGRQHQKEPATNTI